MDKILILDFGSQYTQLIARRVREEGVYSEIHPFNKIPSLEGVRGVILSGSPSSVNDAEAPVPDLSGIRGREYGRAELRLLEEDPLLEGLSAKSVVWMSHGDTILDMPEGFHRIASTAEVANAAYRIDGEKTWGIQFHPEVHHSAEGPKLIRNFIKGICGCKGDWTPESFIESTVAELKEKLLKDGQILSVETKNSGTTKSYSAFPGEWTLLSLPCFCKRPSGSACTAYSWTPACSEKGNSTLSLPPTKAWAFKSKAYEPRSDFSWT